MKASREKNQLAMLLLAIFLIIAGLFSIFKPAFNDYAAWLLAMTGEITLAKVEPGKTAGTPATIRIVTENRLRKSAKKKNRQITTGSKESDGSFKNPVTVNLPKTKTPEIIFSDVFPDWDDLNLVLFTPLRKYDGTVWRHEKTELKGSTDGKKLYLIFRLYDKEPESAVTANTKGSNNNPWNDDSVEVFLMKNRKSKYYCQYGVSVSGKGIVYYYLNQENPKSAKTVDLPQGFISPRYSSDEFDDGFEIELAIDLSNIGIKSLKPEDSLLMQVVRNYRGQSHNNSVILQLFPVYIYGDKRFGASNHDRRSFQKVIVKKK